MSRSFSRADRLKSLFERELNTLFQNALKDPILDGQSIQITNIILSRDVSLAKVYVSVIDKNKETVIVNLLQEKTGFIRQQLGKKMHLKKIPKFLFIQDDSFSKTLYIYGLLDKIREDDES